MNRPVAVVDIGTTSIRMAVAEITPDRQVHTLDSVTQAVNLGRDTFTKGSIEKSTIEDCVRVLKSYRQLMQEYEVNRPDQWRVVATSAVREAANQMAFLDRVYSATGIQAEPIEEAEVNRITYLGLEPLLRNNQTLASATTLITEVGGGSTEVLVLDRANVAFAHTYRLGSLRLRKMLDTYRAPKLKERKIMENQINRALAELADHVPEGNTEIIALGGDVRFAAGQLTPDWDSESLGRLPLTDLEELANSALSMSEDELVGAYHLAPPDAETLGTALLIYVCMARSLRLDHVLVSSFTMRDGLLSDMANPGVWTPEFSNQIIRSALDLGKKFDFDEAHATHVAELCKTLFQALQSEHQLDRRYELFLYIAALLHEIGNYVGSSGHHKHSMYLISNSELFGLSRQDVLLIALVARYHRRASPKPMHVGYSMLQREQRVAVSKLAAILRVADALERSHNQRVKNIRCEREDSVFVISIPGVEDVSLEQLALKEKGSMFEETFGMQVMLRTVRAT